MGATGFISLLIFKTVHALSSLHTFIFSCVTYLQRKYCDFYRAYTNTADYDYVLQHVKYIKKLPQHISIMLNGEEPSYSSLARIIMWCIAAEIPFISLYDYKGVLRKNEDKIQEAVKKMKKTQEPDNHIMWHSANSCKNGHFGRKTHIRTLTVSDGQCSVADLAKQFSICKDKSIEQEVVETAIKDKFVFPDPDLVLYSGDTLSLYGYPPWQIRITEFICIGSHTSVTPEIFVNGLCVFGKIEQRLGK